MRTFKLFPSTLLLIVAMATPARAQWVVTDPALTARNAGIALLKAQVLERLTAKRDQLRKMAKRLSVFTPLARYIAPDVPLWRTHDVESDAVAFSREFQAALNFGDGAGVGFQRVARSRVNPEQTLLDALAPSGRELVGRSLATIDLADSMLTAGTGQTGALRFNGRRETSAIDTLERMVVDPSAEQSTTAILEKLSGAVLLEARQKQARIQLLAALAEQLLLDNKRLRDTDAAALNMQLGRLRDAKAINTRLLAGAGDDLRTWRQP